MRNEYLPFLPVRSEKTAKMLEREAVWKILHFIRKSGMEGNTVKEISEKLLEPISTVYGAIDSLEREGYIIGVKPSKYKKWGRHPKQTKKGKTAKRFFESCDLRAGLAHRKEGEKENPWGDIIFSESFYNEIGRIIKKQPELDEINKTVMKFVKKVCKEKIPSNLNKIMPSTEKCNECHTSHEGYEFLKAVILYIATESVMNSDEFKSLMKELDYKD